MGFFQKAFKMLVSERIFSEMEKESKRWFLICPVCGFEKSIWEVGGMKYKKSFHRYSGGRRTLGKCPQCRKWVFFKVEKRLN